MNVSLQGKQNGLTKNIHKNDKRSANSVIQNKKHINCRTRRNDNL